jgi:peptide/nickel transport system substrate-binding protein
MTYKAPYYLAVGLGPHAFWPLPKHILGEAYERYLQSKNPDDILTHPYWNTEYVHLGPFRLTSFDPGDRISFEAYPGYYLGRPKLDAIHVQIITDQNTALSNLLAGSIQVAPASALTAEAGLEAKRIWDASADGIVHVKSSSIRLFEPQHNPAVQVEPSTFDPRVRRAIYHALDREELAEVLNGSRDRVAWSLLEDGDPLLPAVKDGLRHFTFDPARSRALLAEVGWVAGADGALRHSGDGRTFQLPIWGTPGREQEMHIYASYLRAVGLEVEELMMAAARYRNREYRASFPGWDFTGTSLTKMMTDAASAPQNNWSGNNNGYDDPRARRLVDALESTMVPQEQAQAMKAIHDFVVAELPALPIYFLVQYTAVKKGVKAFEDIAGADGSDRQYGGYARNAYLWDVQ